MRVGSEENKAPEIAFDSRLTQWSKEPKVSDLKGDIEAAKPAHDAQVERIRKWNNLRDVKDDQAPPKVAGRSSIQPRMVRRQAEWRYSALSEPFLGTDKLFEVKPATFEDRNSARQNELVLNHQFRNKIDRVKFIDDLVRSVVDDGTGIVQVGWERVTRMVKETVPVYSFYPITTQEQMEEFSAALELREVNPREFNTKLPDELREAVNFYLDPENAEPQPVIAVESGETEVEVEKVLINKPTLFIHDPANVVIDPSCQGDVERAKFFAISFESSYAELVKQKDRYKNLESVDWENAPAYTDPDHKTDMPMDFQFKDKARKRVLAHEYWGFWDIDGKGSLTPIVATWIGNVMIRLEKNPFPDQKLPFVVIPYLPIKRKTYGETDAELIEDNQKISGAVLRGVVDLLGKSANSQQGIMKGLLDPANKSRFDRGEDYEYNPVADPKNAIVFHNFPEISNSAISLLTIMDQQAESLVGTKNFTNSGMSGEAYGRVAAGIKGMLDAQGIRQMNILRRLAKGVVEIGRKFISMNSIWLSEKEVVRITNATYEADGFEEISREDLAGSFDLIVDVSTAEVDNMQAQDLGFMLQTIGPDMDPQMRNMILAEIARLKRMPDLYERLRTYKPPEPDPLAQQMAQEELRNKQLENAKLESEIALNQARAQAEMVKAHQVNTKTDEDASGITHARDMEKQQAQSIGNQALQITKALTSPGKPGEREPDIASAIGFNAMSATLNNM